VEKAPKHLPVPPALVAEIVAELEALLERLTRPRDAGSLPDGFHVEPAALRLARYYRRIGDNTNMRRAVLTYGDAFATAAKRAAPILAMSWLERVLDTYRSFGLRDAAEAVEIRIRELGPEALKDMKPISASVKVPEQVVEQFLDQVTRGSLEEVLVTLAVQFVPDKGTLTKEVHELAKAAPLSMLFTQTLMDSEGRPVAKVRSVEEDLDGHVVRQTSQHLEMEIPWLHAAIERMRGRLQVSASDLMCPSAEVACLRSGAGPHSGARARGLSQRRCDRSRSDAHSPSGGCHAGRGAALRGVHLQVASARWPDAQGLRRPPP
jgi:hypothetical protein